MVGLIVQFAIGMAIIACALQVLGTMVEAISTWIDTLPRPVGIIVGLSIVGFVFWVISTIITNITTP
jgi:hypothetical protein